MRVESRISRMMTLTAMGLRSTPTETPLHTHYHRARHAHSRKRGNSTACLPCWSSVLSFPACLFSQVPAHHHRPYAPSPPPPPPIRKDASAARPNLAAGGLHCGEPQGGCSCWGWPQCGVRRYVSPCPCAPLARTRTTPHTTFTHFPVPVFRGEDPNAIWVQRATTMGTKAAFLKDPLAWFNDFWFPLFKHEYTRYRANAGHEALARLTNLSANLMVVREMPVPSPTHPFSPFLPPTPPSPPSVWPASACALKSAFPPLLSLIYTVPLPPSLLPGHPEHRPSPPANPSAMGTQGATHRDSWPAWSVPL